MTRRITRRRALAGLSAAGALALAGCTGGGGTGGGNAGGDGGGGSGDTATPTGTSIPADATVTVGPGGDLVYDPAELRVDVGATVAWVWDSGGHTLTVQRRPSGSNWVGTNLSTKEAGHVLTKTFEVAGRYDYYCTPHQSAGMRATLFVGGSTPTSTATPETTADGKTETPSPTDGGGGNDPY